MASALLAEADRLFVDEDYAAALDVYTQALKVEGASVDALVRRAAVHLKLGNNVDAACDAWDACQLDPSNVTALLRYATACVALDEMWTGKCCYEKILRRNPSHKAAQRGREVCLNALRSSSSSSSSSPLPSHDGMRLGVYYHVFDGEELLEASIRSIRGAVDHVCVVYQTVSNFGETCDSGLVTLLHSLVDRHLVDALLRVEPTALSIAEKEGLLSKGASSSEATGPVSSLGDQFFQELRKREAGRQWCHDVGCTHFLGMDVDEFYAEGALRKLRKRVMAEELDATACYMRFYYKEPTIELLPRDDLSLVPAICRLRDDGPLRLAAPFPIVVDPTRRVDNLDPKRFRVLPRSELEMHHMSFVRRDIRRKVANVSNHSNYRDVETFLAAFASWRPGDPVVLPHPFYQRTFSYVAMRKNVFGVVLPSP